jgi:hypothetical protein
MNTAVSARNLLGAPGSVGASSAAFEAFEEALKKYQDPIRLGPAATFQGAEYRVLVAAYGV